LQKRDARWTPCLEVSSQIGSSRTVPVTTAAAVAVNCSRRSFVLIWGLSCFSPSVVSTDLTWTESRAF
jgi:hypothetical protein